MKTKLVALLIAFSVSISVAIGLAYRHETVSDSETGGADVYRRTMEQAERAREYSERTGGEPCGLMVMVIDKSGRLETVCERDLADWEKEGWIRR